VGTRNITLTDEGAVKLQEGSANGIKTVSQKAPSALSSDYILTWMAAPPAGTETLRIDSSGQISTVLDSLDVAYDQGQVVTVDSGAIQLNITGAHIGLDINKTNTGIGNALDIDNDGTGNALKIKQDGAAIALLVEQNSPTHDKAVEIIQASNARGLDINKTGTAGGKALRIKNDGFGDGFLLIQSGNGIAINIDSEASSKALISLLPKNSNSRGDISFGTERTSDPSAPSEGDVWYNSTTNKLVLFDGTSNVNL